MGATTTPALSSLRKRLEVLMPDPTLRPFVCDGSPLDCRVFVVGFNPATSLGREFWHYWSDEDGFDKHAFMSDYMKVRKLRGARPRIQAVVDQFPYGWCLETNICSKPTKRASELDDKGTAIFQLLFDTIKPEIVFVHSNQPIEFFRRITGCQGFEETPKIAMWGGHRFLLSGRPGPLWRMRVEDACVLGRSLGNHLWAQESPDPERGPPLAYLAWNFAQRFREWLIKLPRSDVEARRAGRLAKEGWFIRYCFGRDGRGEFLDYYASHRMMWGDEHTRIYEDGSRQDLPTLSPFYPVSNDPVEAERLQAEFKERNSVIKNMLDAKGFT